MDISNDKYEEMVDIDYEDYLAHYGVGHLDGGHSGRYPYGSGKEPFQHASDFLNRIDELKKSGATYTDPETGKTYTGDTAIAKIIGLSTGDFRAQKSLANAEEKTKLYNRAMALKDSGMGYSEIARKMGLPNESSVRSLLNGDSQNNREKAMKTADFLKDRLDEYGGMIDIGPGVAAGLGISDNKLDEAVKILEQQGYVKLYGSIPNLTDSTGNHNLNGTYLALPGTEKKEAYNLDAGRWLSEDDYKVFREKMGIKSLEEYKTRDNGETYTKGFVYPESLDSSRLAIRYKEDGGIKKDGIIEIRRGVEDLSLGDSTYAQVRILVDNNRYLKGMAIYSDGLPDGIDVLFNTNKGKDVPKLEVLKDATKNLKKDPNNPFGSTIKEDGGQYTYIGADGKQHLGLINKTREEGDWSEWKDKLPSQFLSKQKPELAQRQLGLAVKDKRQEFQDIKDLENNTLKKSLLETFASDCDSAAVHLYAAALPRQKHQVIIPIDNLKDTEVYAPNYKNGEKVALIRYPHGGTFEIPILTVNNRNKEAIDVLGKNTKDCVGINHKVAERLSGADFDGDTVMVLPVNDQIRITSTNQLSALKNFDPKTSYATKKVIDNSGKEHYYNKFGKEVKIMSNTNTQMGIISNLITDMTIAGATEDELARAVKHSMVVIDAEKHKLDYRSSERENGINALKDKYQKHIDIFTGTEKRGASTIISQAKSEIKIPQTQGSPKVNVKYNQKGELNEFYDPNRPEGALIYKTADPNKLSYLKIKDKDSKTNMTVFAKDKDGKLKNAYEKSDGNYYYSGGRDPKTKKNIDILVEKENLYYNKGGKKTIDKKTGKESKVYTKVSDENIISDIRTTNSTRMEQVDDARQLISKYNTRMEQLYATYANTMKALANEARKEAYYTPNSKYNPSAKTKYAKEVESLNNKITTAAKNAPRERQAQVIATSRVEAITKGSTSVLSTSDLKKIKQQQLSKARNEVGARRISIDITDSEWDAIQAGALSDSSLRTLFKYTDTDVVRERATPRAKREVTDVMINRIKSYSANGKTNAEIAEALGLSASTVSKYLKE